jgi:DNA recombination protein RmuC
MELSLVGLVLNICCLLGVVVLCLKRRSNENAAELTEKLQRELEVQLEQKLTQVKQVMSNDVQSLGNGNMQAIAQLSNFLKDAQDSALARQSDKLEQLKSNFADSRIALNEQLAEFGKQVTGQTETLEQRLSKLEQMNERRLAQMQKTLNESMKNVRDESRAQSAQMQKTLRDSLENVRAENRAQTAQMQTSLNTNMQNMREENSKQLEQIRGTVEEKLQTTLEKRISESFKMVSTQLEQVYKGLGEMQSLANDVGGLKKVLSGVKTRGNLGEYQLEAILKEILAPEQYATNVATIPNSSERVEFAVKLPHADGTVYLPIDSKFPGETYAQLRDAQEIGDRDAVEAAYKRLESVIRSEAKDISTKYVEVPYTTNFAIMFLPAEGLYAEVVSRGMVEKLQNDYHVNIAGPSTMAALLNSLQMGFKTLAIQKKSNEAWQVLSAVKMEFEKFGESLKKMQRNLNLTSKELDNLINTRSNAMNRKLRAVESMDALDAARLLELSASGAPADED